MDVREHDLPGIGKKFAMTNADGERLTVIIHNTGDREIYNFRKGEDYPIHAVRLHDAEARKLGAILSGAYFQPTVAGSAELILNQLSVEWVRIDADSPLSGQNLREAGVRERTGASVIAILRDQRAIPNPSPDDVIQEGDTLMVVGDRQQVDRFLSMCRA